MVRIFNKYSYLLVNHNKSHNILRKKLKYIINILRLAVGLKLNFSLVFFSIALHTKTRFFPFNGRARLSLSTIGTCNIKRPLNFYNAKYYAMMKRLEFQR